MRSIQTKVGWLAIDEPPGSAAAFAPQTGSRYHVAPTNGLSKCWPPLEPEVLELDEELLELELLDVVLELEEDELELLLLEDVPFKNGANQGH